MHQYSIHDHNTTYSYSITLRHYHKTQYSIDDRKVARASIQPPFSVSHDISIKMLSVMMCGVWQTTQHTPGKGPRHQRQNPLGAHAWDRQFAAHATRASRGNSGEFETWGLPYGVLFGAAQHDQKQICRRDPEAGFRAYFGQWHARGVFDTYARDGSVWAGARGQVDAIKALGFETGYYHELVFCLLFGFCLLFSFLPLIWFLCIVRLLLFVSFSTFVYTLGTKYGVALLWRLVWESESACRARIGC